MAKHINHTLFCHRQALYCRFDSWDFVNGHFTVHIECSFGAHSSSSEPKKIAWIPHFWDEIPETCDKTCSSSLIYREMIHGYQELCIFITRVSNAATRKATMKTANDVAFVDVVVIVGTSMEQKYTLASTWHKITFRPRPINLLRFIFVINPPRTHIPLSIIFARIY